MQFINTDIGLSAFKLAEIGSIGDILVAHDYFNNHDHFEVLRRRRGSTNAAAASGSHFPRGRTAERGSPAAVIELVASSVPASEAL